MGAKKLRTPLKQLGQSMEHILRIRDRRYKRGTEDRPWLDGHDVQHFFDRAMEEMLELRDAIRRGKSLEIGHEAADVANFMMMIHDIATKRAGVKTVEDLFILGKYPACQGGKATS